MEYLHIICFGLLAFFSFTLLSKRNKPLSEKIFSVWIIVLMLTVLSFFIYARGMARQYAVFVTLTCDSHLIHGSMLFIYTRAFINADFRLRRIHLLHLLPVLGQIFGKLYLNFVVDKMDCYELGGCLEEDNIYVTASYIYKYTILGIYIFLTGKIVFLYRKNANKPREVMRSEWVKQIVQGSLFLYLGIFILHIIRSVFPGMFWDKMLIGNVLTTLFIFILLYIGNYYTYLFVVPSKNRFKNLSETVDPKNCLREEEIYEFTKKFQRLTNFMHEEKPFLRGGITLKSLSEQLQIPQAMISRIIYELSGQTFSDYVNSFKVDYLKKLLEKPDSRNYKIMTLSEESGFNSKSSLIRIFKQFTGETPSEYQLRVHNEDNSKA